MVGEPHRHVEEFTASGGPVVGDAGLDEVARAVQLVAPAQVLVALAALEELEPGVQIAVGLLGVRDQGDDALHLPASGPSSSGARPASCQDAASSHL